MTSVIPFNKPFVVGKELYNIAQSVMNGQISGNGPYARACEKILSQMCGGSHVSMVPSCTAGLELACILIDLKPGDEVIMPSFTFVSTANAVALRGAIPVFCDICPDTFNIDADKIEACITEKTKAILPVHYAGQGCDMVKINGIAKKHGLYVIEDAAQGVGAYQDGKHLGAFGDLAAYSFHETKNIVCGEGGALVINNPDFVHRAEIIKEKGTNRSAFLRGQVDKYTWVDIGSSYLPSELQMAFLLSQLEQVKRITDQRRLAFDFYHEHLAGLEADGHLKRPVVHENNQINYHLYAILCNSLDERSELIDFMKARQIHPVFHYVPLHSSPAGKKYTKTPHDMSVTDHVSSCLLRLPIYYEITPEEMQRVVDGIVDFYAKHPTQKPFASQSLAAP